MKIFCDLDDTLCSGPYETAIPLKANIEKINRLYDEGNDITIWTSRGGNHFGDVWERECKYRDLTERWLKENGVKHHRLSFAKPAFDAIIDDKSENWSDENQDEVMERILAKAEKSESIPVILGEVVDKPSFKIEEDQEDPWLQK